MTSQFKNFQFFIDLSYTFITRYVSVVSSLSSSFQELYVLARDNFVSSAAGQGSSLIICIGILKGYSETLLKMLMNLNRRFMHSFNLWLHAIPGSDFFFN